MPTITTSLADIAAAARPIVEAMVHCVSTTVGPDDRPRSRVVHPVWDWSAPALVGWVTSRPTPLKLRHLASHPVMTCAYWSPAHDTVVLDCEARWVDEHERQTVWELIASTPPPVGFDPATIWPGGPGSDDFAPIELTPYRIQTSTAVQMAAGQPSPQWTRA
jgi:hypothetical protein